MKLEWDRGRDELEWSMNDKVQRRGIHVDLNFSRDRETLRTLYSRSTPLYAILRISTED